MPTVCNPRSQNSQVQPILRQAAAVFLVGIYICDRHSDVSVRRGCNDMYSGVF